MDVYGLLVYEIVLFPHMEDYIDQAAIDIFLANRDRGENPTMEILANTYYTLSYYCERQGKSLRCCAHLLYLLLTAHLFHNKRKTTCPIEDFKWRYTTQKPIAENTTEELDMPGKMGLRVAKPSPTIETGLEIESSKPNYPATNPDIKIAKHKPMKSWKYSRRRSSRRSSNR
ncbi:hypothetical protein CR513_10952, partial [Mucuna pruriens]